MQNYSPKWPTVNYNRPTPKPSATAIQCQYTSFPKPLREEALLAVPLGGSPDGKAKSSLVHEVCKVVNQIERVVIDRAEQISEQVAKRVDRPADCHDVAHSVERIFHIVGRFVGRCAGSTREDFKQNEAPSTQAHDETDQGGDDPGFTGVTGSQHHKGADQQPPEHHSAEVRLHCREDQEEFDHLQRNSDQPINVTIKDRGAVELNPELPHVEIMNGCNQSDQRTDIHGRFPMVFHCYCFCYEEDGPH